MPISICLWYYYCDLYIFEQNVFIAELKILKNVLQGALFLKDNYVWKAMLWQTSDIWAGRFFIIEYIWKIVNGTR